MDKYQPQKIESKWQRVWEKHKLYQTIDPPAGGRPKKYLLVEFPYPSGEGLHIGHAFTNTILDVLVRKKRMEGFNILHPMGWDAFGLPTENYAIKTGIHPEVATEKNTNQFREQMKRLAFSYNWDREINTTDPDYYRWTQWIFIQFFKHGLAYKAEAPVGWCPACKIILANEEIVSGKCERCGAQAERKMQAQWLLGITAYADRLIDDLDKVDYPDYVKAAQRNWIGRSEGTEIEFPLETTLRVGESREAGGKTLRVDKITVFTTRADTLFGVTALVLAPEHALVQSLLLSSYPSCPSGSSTRAVRKYVQVSRKKSELERTELTKEKTGVFTGLYCQHPITKEKLPIWVGDYVVAGYGGGAVMVVPAHDQRDFEFARKYNLPIRPVISPKSPKSPKLSSVFEDDGILVNSGQFTGLASAQARRKITAYLEKKGLGRAAVSYHLRDWIFSRQHYWGEPIPMIFCPACAKKGITYPNLPDFPASPDLAGWFPVPEDQLPLKLPKVKKYQPTDTGESPLANVKDWVKTTCPYCQGPARRETDTMPNWAGSSWYYLAYVFGDKLDKPPRDTSEVKSADTSEVAVRPNIFKKYRDLLNYWLPVDLYLGGAEHTTLHLLYSRFWHKFLNDIGLVPNNEPYAARRQHGVILGEDGFRMSKSRGNIINPEEVVKEYGADTLRLYLMFMGPYEDTMPWNTRGVEGAYRFLNRVWKLVLSSLDFPDFPDHPDPSPLVSFLNRLIKKVGEDIEALKHNTAIAAMMEFVNSWSASQRDSKDLHSFQIPSRKAGSRSAGQIPQLPQSRALSRDDLRKFLLLLAPFAPHITEELWQRLTTSPRLPKSPRFSIHRQPWPQYDSRLVKQEKVTVVVQVNGKLRDRLEMVSAEARDKKKVVELALASAKVRKHLGIPMLPPRSPKLPRLPKFIFVPGKLVNFVT